MDRADMEDRVIFLETVSPYELPHGLMDHFGQRIGEVYSDSQRDTMEYLDSIGKKIHGPRFFDSKEYRTSQTYLLPSGIVAVVDTDRYSQAPSVDKTDIVLASFNENWNLKNFAWLICSKSGSFLRIASDEANDSLERDSG